MDVISDPQSTHTRTLKCQENLTSWSLRWGDVVTFVSSQNNDTVLTFDFPKEKKTTKQVTKFSVVSCLGKILDYWIPQDWNISIYDCCSRVLYSFIHTSTLLEIGLSYFFNSAKISLLCVCQFMASTRNTLFLIGCRFWCTFYKPSATSAL